MKCQAVLKRCICVLLCAVQVIAIFASMNVADAASSKTFTLAQSQNLAISNSADMKKKYNEILLKKMKYIEAVKAIKAKIKNLTSFRYSPLLTFKFPQQLNMTEEYELNIKPLTLQAEISTLEHALADLKYAALNEVNKAYLEAYIYQEKISFTQERLDSAESELSRNQARLLIGEATQTDIDKMQKSVEALTTELANLKRSLESAKSELADITGLDVTSGYRFTNPMKTADIPRKDLNSLIQYALDNDQTYYEAKMAASTALLNLNSYTSLMQSQYGSKMDIIMPYINMAKQGMTIDYTAFKTKYDEMLKKLDEPWSWNITILFFTFTLEWFKGEISGTRYIEDEMYAVYTACKEYASALKAQQAAEKSLRKQVSKAYESLITARNAYYALADTLTSAKESLEKVSALNKLGKAEYSELKDKQDDYEEIQLETIDALGSYDELLYDFDRLTCGGVTKYLNGEALTTDAGEGGDSYAEIDQIDEPYYYIYTDVENMVFVFGVNIPEDFQPEITGYEIWYEGTKIGERTIIDKQLRHLALDYGDSNTLTVRFYNNNDYVSECDIDTTVSRDVLNLKGEVEAVAATEKAVGSYKVSTTSLGKISTSVLTITPDPGLGIKYYSLAYGDGASIYSGELIAAEDSFSYLTLLVASMDSVTLTLYDSSKTKLYTARFDSATQKIMAKT